jgi:hypothetical protein
MLTTLVASSFLGRVQGKDARHRGVAAKHLGKAIEIEDAYGFKDASYK